MRNPFDYTELFNRPHRVTRRVLSDYVKYSRAPGRQAARDAVARTASRTARLHREWAPVKITFGTSCRMDGAEQERFIDGELLRGRPVAVSMALDGLGDWGQTTPTGGDGRAYHAFIIKGMRVWPDGTKYYSTRNSWGGIDPMVEADHLCRVIAVESLVLPGERPAAESATDALLNP